MSLQLRQNLYKLSLKKGRHLMFDNNFAKCGPIYKIFSPVNSSENSVSSMTQKRDAAVNMT